MSPLLALLAFQTATIEPAKDPAYAKPITVHLAMSSLRTVVRELAKATGQPLDASGVVADWKATVLVRDLPAGRTMEALADALGLVWKRDGGLILLGRADGAAGAESAYVAAERAKAQNNPMGVPAMAPATVANDMRVAPGQRGARRGRPGGGGRTVYARFDPNLLTMEMADGQPPTRLEPAVPTGDSAFAKAVLAWPSVPQTLEEGWRRPIPTPMLMKSTWESGAYAVSDLLVAFHDASGLPVVADAFRVPSRVRTLTPGTAIGVLQGIAASGRMSFRLADGVARMRHPAFWRLREQEVPESAWALLEPKGATVASLASLASFATGLKPAQVAAFRSQEAPLSHVPTVAVREAYPALLLWSALSTPARNALLAGRPVGLAEVRGATRAYTFALQEAPYYRAGDPTRVLAMDPSTVGLFGAANGKTLEIRLAGERGGGVTYLLPL